MVKKLGAGTVSLCKKNQDSGATFINSIFFSSFGAKKVALTGVFSVFGGIF